MAKVKSVFDSIFLKEESSSKTEKNKSLKLFYNMDIHIINPNKNPPQEPVQQEPVQQPVPQQQVPEVPAQPVPQQIPQISTESKMLKRVKMMLEDDFTLGSSDKTDSDDYTYKNEGILNVPQDEFENIQTLDDLLDFMSDSKDESGKQVLDEAAVELVLSMIGITQTPLEDLVKKDDKVFIDVTYGNKKDDSIGFKVLKRDGVNNLSIVMKKNNEILDAKFDLKSFNSQILEFRNGIINKKG